MTDDFQIGLLLLFLFQIKHTLADFFLQTDRMLSNRSIYAHMGRVEHAGLHALFSVGILLFVGLSLPAILVICLVEWVAHFHIDWLKGVYSERRGHGPESRDYWRAFGVDQLAHQLTYIAMIWASVA